MKWKETKNEECYKVTNVPQAEDLRTMRPEVRRLLETGQVFGVHQQTTSDLRSSKLKLEDGRLHLYHLLDQPPPQRAHTVQVLNIPFSFGGGSCSSSRSSSGVGIVVVNSY